MLDERRMGVNRRFVVILFFIFLTLNIPNTMAIIDLMALQGSAYDSGSPINNGNLTVTIWDSPAGGSLIYNTSTDYIGAVNNGRYDILIGEIRNLSLDYGTIYYMDLKINGQDLSFNGSARRMFQSSTGTISNLFIKQAAVNNNSLNVTNQGAIGQVLTLGANGQFTWSNDQTGADGNGNWSVDATQTYTTLNVNTSSNVTALNFFGSVNWSYLLNVPSYVKDWSSEINAINSTANIQSFGFNTTTQLSNLYLGITDQRYNDTGFVNSLISAVNSSANIQDLGFNTTSQLNNVYLALTDQRYNETALINSLIAAINTTSNVQDLGFNTTSQLNNIYLAQTDQRYNETSHVNVFTQNNTFLNNTFLAVSGGNVGIGTTDPANKLTVIGNINVSGTIYNENDCGVSSAVVTWERNTISSAQFWSLGNGATTYGMPQACPGVITAWAAMCSGTIGTSLDVNIVMNGDTANPNATMFIPASAGVSNFSSLNIGFSAGDVFGVYAGTETGAWTACVATVYFRYD